MKTCKASLRVFFKDVRQRGKFPGHVSPQSPKEHNLKLNGK